MDALGDFNGGVFGGDADGDAEAFDQVEREEGVSQQGDDEDEGEGIEGDVGQSGEDVIEGGGEN